MKKENECNYSLFNFVVFKGLSNCIFALKGVSTNKSKPGWSRGINHGHNMEDFTLPANPCLIFNFYLLMSDFFGLIQTPHPPLKSDAP